MPHSPEHGGELVDFGAARARRHGPSDREFELTKRQLANHAGRSTRWVELQVRDHGLPAHWDSRRLERRFLLSEFEQWRQKDAA